MPGWPGKFALLSALTGVVATTAGTATAGGLALDMPNPRAVGRAGTDAVSADSGSAVLMSPAGLARREDTRLTLSTAIIDSDAHFRTAGASDSPTISDAASARLMPLVAVHGAIGPVILGAVYMTTGDTSRQLPEPLLNEADDDVARLFPHRYGGTTQRTSRRTFALGAAVRATDWLGLGLAGAVSRVHMAERRRIWAGYAGRDPLGYPSRDLALSLDGDDNAAVSASTGALIAPPEIPVELAVSVLWNGAAHLDGTATLEPASSNFYPAIRSGEGEAAISASQPLLVRAGARYLGERFFVELGADMSWVRGSERRVWHISGLEVEDQTGLTSTLDSAPALAHQHSHLAVRGAVDYELVREFVWATAGYAWQQAASDRRYLSPGFGDPGGHTIGLGAEIFYEDIAVTVGYARRLMRATNIAAETSEVELINPFDAGTASAAAGRHRTATDQVGVSVELSWY